MYVSFELYKSEVKSEVCSTKLPHFNWTKDIQLIKICNLHPLEHGASLQCLIDNESKQCFLLNKIPT